MMARTDRDRKESSPERGAWRERLALRVVECLSALPDQVDFVEEVLRAIVAETGLSSAGVRLREGDDYQFYTYHGASDEFVRLESSLLVRGPDGELVTDDEGHPGLACLCGALLLGNTEHAPSLHTSGGSFFAPSLQAQVCEIDRDRVLSFREQCVAAGYETLVLVPLRHDGKTIGLLHLADPRPGALELSDVALLERLGVSIGAGLARHLAEEALRKENERVGILLRLHERAPALTDAELYDFVLEQVVRLTDSEIGFLHLVSSDARFVTLTAWNARARERCTAIFDDHYPVEAAGNWADCLRERRPVVYNNFESAPNRKGLPEGHAPVRRFVSIPVYEGDEPRIIFGVGNKLRPYHDRDVNHLQLVANELQRLVQQRRVEKGLRDSEERWRTIVESEPECVKLLDRDGCILEMNPAGLAMIEATLEQVRGKPARSLVAERDRPAFDAMVEAVFSGKREHLVFDMIGLAGRRSTLETSSGPLWDSAERREVKALLGITRDITERVRAEEAARHAQKMESVGRLAGGVAHDFNNLLAIIMGYAEMGLAVTPASMPQRSQLVEILRATQKAAALSKQLLLFARHQAPELRPLDLNEVVSGAMKMLHRVIGEDVELAAVLDPAVWPVHGDQAQLEQVLVNLVVNARDAMPGGGRITIATSNLPLAAGDAAVGGESVMLAVSDTGAGMSDEVRAHLFEPFFTTKEPGRGTGLGLATCFGIVKEHGGVINVDTAPDLGTVFRVVLPRLKGEHEKHRELASATAPPRGSETVLLVEDDDQLRHLLAGYLRQQGYQVLEASDGEDALTLPARARASVDAVVTDVVMPHLGGPELIRRMRAARPDLKVLLISGYGDGAGDRTGASGSHDAVLQKPFLPAELAAQLGRLLGR
jgi:PAS domain S-box-containing protein